MMDMYPQYKSRLGYATGDNKIDSYGVDHSGFTTRDELEYQRARTEREQQLIQEYNRRGIANNYPQYGTNFWGNPENNYGFGSSDIHDNIENMQGQPLDVRENSFNSYSQPYQLAQDNLQNIKREAENKVNYSLYGDGFSKEFIDEMQSDKRFQDIMNNRVKINEGGYVNHPDDRGGETKYGISSRWYPDEDIKNLTRERANMILFRDYWKNTNIHQLPDGLADIVLDDSIVQGQPTAIKNLQKALGVEDDGIIGQNTLNAIKNANFKTLKAKFIENVKNVEEQYLNNDPSQRIFEKGHKNRFNKY